MSDARYKIIRMYFDNAIPTRTIKKNLTLDQAQAHCQDPETSSSTCTNRVGVERTRRIGAWFDGYTRQ